MHTKQEKCKVYCIEIYFHSAKLLFSTRNCYEVNVLYFTILHLSEAEISLCSWSLVSSKSSKVWIISDRIPLQQLNLKAQKAKTRDLEVSRMMPTMKNQKTCSCSCVYLSRRSETSMLYVLYLLLNMISLPSVALMVSRTRLTSWEGRAKAVRHAMIQTVLMRATVSSRTDITPCTAPGEDLVMAPTLICWTWLVFLFFWNVWNNSFQSEFLVVII